MNHMRFLNYLTLILVLLVLLVLLLPALPVFQTIGRYILIFAPLIAAAILFFYYRRVKQNLSENENKRYVWSLVAWVALGAGFGVMNLILVFLY